MFIFKKSKTICDKIVHRNILSAAPLQLKRAVILTKMTRYEVEREYNPDLGPEELKQLVKSRGSNYESLMEHHQRHKSYEQYVINAFKDSGIDTKLLKKSDYTIPSIEWCDAVFPIGGDGTFLLAASRVHQNTKPVIGFNSDPQHSEGFLCLPKKYSTNIKHVLLRLKEGSFNWMLRTRIRVTVKSKQNELPIDVPDKRILGIHRTEMAQPVKHMSSSASRQSPLPSLALNEVFIGESLSSQVSYLEMKLSPGGEHTKVKSSGLCLSTGTGSSSWHLSMNRLTPQSVNLVLQCAEVSSKASAHEVAAKYNDALLFDPEMAKISYTIRDLISAGVWPSPPGLAPRGFATAVWVRSHCRDARLVLDGGCSYAFNDGSEAFFELHPEDTLRTVIM